MFGIKNKLMGKKIKCGRFFCPTLSSMAKGRGQIYKGGALVLSEWAQKLLLCPISGKALADKWGRVQWARAQSRNSKRTHVKEKTFSR